MKSFTILITEEMLRAMGACSNGALRYRGVLLSSIASENIEAVNKTFAEFSDGRRLEWLAYRIAPITCYKYFDNYSKWVNNRGKCAKYLAEIVKEVVSG